MDKPHRVYKLVLTGGKEGMGGKSIKARVSLLLLSWPGRHFSVHTYLPYQRVIVIVRHWPRAVDKDQKGFAAAATDPTFGNKFQLITEQS